MMALVTWILGLVVLWDERKKHPLYQLKTLLMTNIHSPKWFKTIVGIALAWNLMEWSIFTYKLASLPKPLLPFPWKSKSS